MAERPCSICSNGSRLSIDQAILNGKALRAIARDFSIGSGEPGTDKFRPDHKKVERHRDRCMGEAYRAAREADLESSGLALVNRMKELDQAVDEVLTRTREGETVRDDSGIPLLNDDGSPVRKFHESAILAAIREGRRNTELRARLSGAVPDADPEALDRQRAALTDPRARRLMAELDEVLNATDQELPK